MNCGEPPSHTRWFNQMVCSSANHVLQFCDGVEDEKTFCLRMGKSWYRSNSVHDGPVLSLTACLYPWTITDRSSLLLRETTLAHSISRNNLGKNVLPSRVKEVITNHFWLRGMITTVFLWFLLLLFWGTAVLVSILAAPACTTTSSRQLHIWTHSGRDSIRKTCSVPTQAQSHP